MNPLLFPKSSAGRTRRSSFPLFRFSLAWLVAAPVAVLPPHVRAELPAGAQVRHGAVGITQAGTAMTLTQTSRNAIVNWQSFGIGTGESVRLVQPGADAAMLARVVGNDPSKLLGSLRSDGKLFLINPRGIVVGPGAVIDTAAFVASTHHLGDADFLRGTDLVFKGDSAAGIVNLGTIRAREGSVLLFAHTVTNAGAIDAPRGIAGLGAGTEVHLASPETGNFTIKLNLPAATEKTGVENSGAITAVQARLEAAGGSIYELAINQSGIVRATGSATVHGRVLLTAAGGTVGVSGGISARNADGSGGEILVGGDYRGGNAAVANAARTVVTSGAKLDASATTGAAGRVVVWADDATRFLGMIDAQGAGGGFAEVSGKRFLDFRPAAPVQLGAGGTLLLDPAALVVSTAADSGTGTGGADPFIFGATAEPATLNVTTLQNQLALTNVTLDTSTSAGDITVDNAVTWSTNNTLRLQAGGSINLNASLTGGATSTLALLPGRNATPSAQGQPILNNRATLAAGATISVGTLTYGANAQSAPAGYTIDAPAGVAPLTLNGNVSVHTLEIDLSAGAAGVTTNGSSNAIGTFRTTGTGTLSGAYVVDHEGGLDVTIDSSTTEGPYLQFITPGALTLKSGSSLDFASPGTVLLASTGGAFVNEAGGSVFGGNTRFLIYSNSPGATTKDGLGGTGVFNHAFDSNDDFSGDTLSRFFYTVASGLPILTYVADGLTRAYGAANPALTFTATGWQQSVINDVTGAPALSTTATQNSGVGAYAISIGVGTLGSSNYDFSFVPGTFTIDRAPLAITANDKTRRVDLANPAFDAAFSGFVLGENASALGGTLAFATPATVSSPTGTYAITPSGLTSSNYDLTFLPGSLSITATAALLISADNVARTYGAANPGFTASYSGLVAGDDASVVTGLQFSTAATQASGIGLYAITPFGASATGYDINYGAGSLTIERAPLTLSVPGQSRLYGDANNFIINYLGLVNGETSSVVSGLGVTSPATPASPVGIYAINASGASAANYAISYSVGALAVTPAPLTVTIADVTRPYGDANPAFTFAVAGLKNGETADDAVTMIGLAATATAASGIGSYGILGTSFVNSSNYTATTLSGSLTVTPRPLMIAADNATRVYGDPNPAFTATFHGLVNGDTNAVATSLNFVPAGGLLSGVGHYAITPTGTTSANYTPVFAPGTLSITPATLTGAIDNATRFYGDANPAFSFSNVVGFKNSDNLATLTGVSPALSSPATPLSNVGSYAVTGSAVADNYVITLTPATLAVTLAPLTVGVANANRTYGEANPAFSVAYINGFRNDDTSSLLTGLSLGTVATAASNAGNYAIDGTATAANYAVTFVPGRLSVGRASATITAGSGSRAFGDTLALIPGFFGFLAADEPLARSNWIATPDSATFAPGLRFVGFAETQPAIGAVISQNYLITFVTGSLFVGPRPVDVTAPGAVFTAGALPASFSATAPAPLAGGPAYTVVGRANATNASGVGAYTITPEIVPGAGITRAGLDQYYAFNLIPGQLTLTPPTLEIDPSFFTPKTLTPLKTTTLAPETKTKLTTDLSTKITIIAPADVGYDTPPLTKAEFANYFGTFDEGMVHVKGSLAPAFAKFLDGAGKAGSAYENMSVAARTLLKDWMGGALSDAALQEMIAAGRLGAAEAFSYILPTLVDYTRAKEVDQMTGADRQILGRLADLTEQRRADTVALALQKFEEKLKRDAGLSDKSFMMASVMSETDFPSILKDSSQEVLVKYLASTIPTAAVMGSVTGGLLATKAAAAVISTGYGTSAAFSAGPAVVAVAFVAVLCARSVQLAESIKNEAEFNSFIAAYKFDEQLTSIATLKSSAMTADMQLSTMMLASELFKPAP